jgi:hypothetical protein
MESLHSLTFGRSSSLASNACLALSGSDLGGRSLRVNEAKAK